MIKSIQGIGEIVIRVNNMELMCHFYHQILGLELIKTDENFTFFKVAEGKHGHPQIIALFHKKNPTAFGEVLDEIDHNHSSMHHMAFEIDKADYDETLNCLEKKGIKPITQVFEWVKWRSIFIKDPESNIIEFVCYDKDIGQIEI